MAIACGALSSWHSSPRSALDSPTLGAAVFSFFDHPFASLALMMKLRAVYGTPDIDIEERRAKANALLADLRGQVTP